MRSLIAKLGLTDSDDGYGHKDKELFDALRAAKSPEEADAIGADDGHKNAAGAVAWLKSRSGEGGWDRPGTPSA